MLTTSEEWMFSLRPKVVMRVRWMAAFSPVSLSKSEILFRRLLSSLMPEYNLAQIFLNVNAPDAEQKIPALQSSMGSGTGKML